MALEGLYAQVGQAPGQLAEGLQRNKLVNANILAQQQQLGQGQQTLDMKQQAIDVDAQKQQQYNALLSQFLGPNQGAMAAQGIGQPQAPQQGGNALLSQMYQVDPERTAQILTAQRQEQAAQQKQQREEAAQVVRAGQYILESKAPKSLLKTAFPELVSGLKQQGVNVEDMDDDQVRELATQTIAQYGPMAGIDPTEKKASESPFAKINPADYTRESVKAFERTGTFADLIPTTKPSADEGDKNFTRANVLRDEYNAANKDFGTIQAAYGNIVATAREPSAAGDISLITSYMKMLDPASTVREGEFANAENAGGIPSQIRAKYNKALNGERLTTDTRADFVKQAGNLFGERQKQADKNRERYAGLAQRYGVPAADVIGDVGAPPPSALPAPTASKVIGGVTYVQQNGQWYADDGT